MMETVLIGVLDVSLQMSLLLLLLFAADKFLSKRVSAQAKCWIWAICGIRLLVPATFSFSVPQSGIVYAQETVNAAVPTAAAEAVAQAVSAAPAVTEPAAFFQAPVERLYAHITVLEVLAIVWIAVAVVFLLAHLALYLLQARFLRKNGKAVVDGEILAQLEQVKAELHVTRSIRLLVSEKAESPMLIGLFCSSLVLPRLEFTPEQLSIILHHELAHCRRCDLPVKWLFLLVRSVHWFNPLVHILAKKADFDLESACDDTVLRGKDKSYRKQYGNTLLHVLAARGRGPALSTRFSGNTKEIIRRFQNIVSVEPKRRGIVLLCCVLAGAVVLTSGLNPATARTLSANLLSQVQAAESTPQELAALKQKLALCVKDSVFESYRPFRDLSLDAEAYQRCEQAEAAYRDLLLQYREGWQTREFVENAFFLAVDSNAQGPVTTGIFCCQNDNQMEDEDITLIWLDFSNANDLQVVDIGHVYPGGNHLNEKLNGMQAIQREQKQIAEAFQIDLSQYEKADSGVYPIVIRNQAFFIKSSIEKQLMTTGRYQFEKFHVNHARVYLRKDETGGVLLNLDDNGMYAHFFALESIDRRNRRKSTESQYPITENRCIS
ncbi:M56 family metallopeptidase [Anaeromassilibacillus senegalensis]|uniref:M56 family metallopeptidase n=1 Tax=Anaeromassilibacillus senegalensis TaxID=1673717 RepID=UPI00067FC5BE|nr:M56 family metallopeptidase [Anaeromassilibacillus senegalensis]